MKKIIFALSFSFAAINYFAQDGTLDNTFGTGGIVTTAVGSSDEYANAVKVQSDGKIVVVGYSKNGVYNDFALTRYNVNGTLDNTFGSSGKVTTSLGNYDDFALCASIQSDGKIIAAGICNNGTNDDFAMVRYNLNGTLDVTFGTNGKVITSFGNGNDDCNSVAIQSDGSIIAAGFSYNGTDYDFALARYNSSGALDTSFGTAGKVTTAIGTSNDYGNAISLQSDGKLVLIGNSNNGLDDDFAIVRYYPTGILDSNFGAGGKSTTDINNGNEQGRSLAIQNDGNIIIAGVRWLGSIMDVALARYDSTGNLDSGFGTGGYLTTDFGTSADYISSVVIQSDYKIVVSGSTNFGGTNYNFALARYTSTGSLDNSFGTGGVVSTSVGPLDAGAGGLAIQSDGKLIVAGFSNNGANNYDFAVARYNNNSIIGTNEIPQNDYQTKIYPNPFLSSTTIEISDPQFTKGYLIVYDLLGNAVHKQNLNSKIVNLNLELSDGIYSYEIKNEKKEFIGNGKIVIQK